MINQLELPMFLEDALPEISTELKLENNKSAFNSINALTKLAHSKACVCDYATVKRCFSVADSLYGKGNNIVKTAIENVFVYSFTKMFQGDRANTLRGMVPMALYSVYISQVCHRGS